ncbi:MAG TPA: hypothetical protein VFK52_06990 [Nocardioidaceae bacterium]|nr:hypothetical protein [Nocardioidaceae bacterium]
MGPEDSADYGYDLSHEADPAATAPVVPQQPVRVSTETDDDGQDLSYDLAHDVPR